MFILEKRNEMNDVIGNHGNVLAAIKGTLSCTAPLIWARIISKIIGALTICFFCRLKYFLGAFATAFPRYFQLCL